MQRNRGSGKTTLLNHILNDETHGMKFAVIENEFGDVGIDEKIISENVDEEVIEVMNGCICCTVRGDLVEALKKLYKRVESFDGILIETTGLADPAPVIQTFFVDEDIQQMYKLDSVITVVDAKHIIPRLDEKKPEGVENEAEEQVVFADRVSTWRYIYMYCDVSLIRLTCTNHFRACHVSNTQYIFLICNS